MPHLNCKNKRQIKLCIITTVPISIISFYGEQIDFLADRGFDITVITSPDNELEKRISKKARLILIPMTRVVSPLRDLIALLKVFNYIRNGEFDIIQYSSPKAALLGSISSWFCHVPVRLYLMWGLFYTGQQGFKRYFLKFFEKVACFCSTHVSPDSNGNMLFAVQEKLCSLSKLSVVGIGSANGTDLKRFDSKRLKPMGEKIRLNLNIPSHALVFGFVGRLRRDKGVNELIFSFENLNKKYPDIYLLLLGSQEAAEDEFDNESRVSLVKNKHIISVGYQEKPEEFMSAMDVFVLPSYREGFGVVNIEASAMGLPVISTDIPGPRDSVINGKTGILVKVKSVEELTEAMEKLINDLDLRKNMGEAGRQWSNSFDQISHWEAIKEHRLNLLRKANIGV